MIIELINTSDTPIYVQLRNQIVLGIGRGELKVGDHLPTVRQMAEDAGINMMTVNKAYNVLKQEGFITLDKRRGAVIALDENKIRAVEEMRQQLQIVLAKACCRAISREEIHELVDEILDEYES